MEINKQLDILLQVADKLNEEAAGYPMLERIEPGNFDSQTYSDWQRSRAQDQPVVHPLHLVTSIHAIKFRGRIHKSYDRS